MWGESDVLKLLLADDEVSKLIKYCFFNKEACVGKVESRISM